jgi:hypothetical protein
MNLKFWQKTEYRVKVITRDRTNLSLDEWRSDQALCNAAGKALLNPNIQAMLDVLRNSHPAYFVHTGSISMEDRAVLQARSEGYTLALSNLEALAIHRKPPTEVEATFEPEQPEEK